VGAHRGALDARRRRHDVPPQFSAKTGDSAMAPVLVKRDPRSRLFDTAEGRYVSLDELRQWVSDGIAFCVEDLVTGEDVTLALLA
jgi:polyhydroxyalkanoate synthesis regulator protein